MVHKDVKISASGRLIFIMIVGLAAGILAKFPEAKAAVEAKNQLKTEICFVGDSNRCFALSNSSAKKDLFENLGVIQGSKVLHGKKLEPYLSANIVRTVDDFKRKHKMNLSGNCELVVTFSAHENEWLTNSEKYCVGKKHFNALAGMLERIMNSPDDPPGKEMKSGRSETAKGLKNIKSHKR